MRARCTLFVSLLLTSFAFAQNQAERYVFPGTRLSVALLDDRFVPDNNQRRLSTTDGTALLKIASYPAELETKVNQSVFDALPDGPQDTIALLDGLGFVVVVGSLVPASDYHYAGKLVIPEGQRAYIKGKVDQSSAVTSAMMLATLQTLRVDAEAAPPFSNTAYWFDADKISLQYCTENGSSWQTIFTPDGRCSPVDPKVSSLVASRMMDDGAFYEKTATKNRDTYNMKVTGFIETPYGNFERFENDLNDGTGQKLLMYLLNYDGATYAVQSILFPDQGVEVEQLDQFVATFKPQ